MSEKIFGIFQEDGSGEVVCFGYADSEEAAKQICIQHACERGHYDMTGRFVVTSDYSGPLYHQHVSLASDLYYKELRKIGGIERSDVYVVYNVYRQFRRKDQDNPSLFDDDYDTKVVFGNPKYTDSPPDDVIAIWMKETKIGFRVTWFHGVFFRHYEDCEMMKQEVDDFFAGRGKLSREYNVTGEMGISQQKTLDKLIQYGYNGQEISL